MAVQTATMSRICRAVQMMQDNGVAAGMEELRLIDGFTNPKVVNRVAALFCLIMHVDMEQIPGELLEGCEDAERMMYGIQDNYVDNWIDDVHGFLSDHVIAAAVVIDAVWKRTQDTVDTDAPSETVEQSLLAASMELLLERGIADGPPIL